MIKIEMDQERIAKFVLEVEKLRQTEWPPRCRCIVLPWDKRLKDTGELRLSITMDSLKNKTDRTDKTYGGKNDDV